MLRAWRVLVSRRSILRHCDLRKPSHPACKSIFHIALRSPPSQGRFSIWAADGPYTRGLATQRDVVDNSFDDLEEDDAGESEVDNQESESDYEDTHDSNGDSDFEERDETGSDFEEDDATGSDYEDATDEENGSSYEKRSTDLANPNKDSIRQGTSSKSPQVRTLPARKDNLEGSSDTEQEDDINADGDDQLESLLDMQTDAASQHLGDQDRPLWSRVQEAAVQKQSMKAVMKAWVHEGNPLTRELIIFTFTILRRRRQYNAALELSDWVMTHKPYKLEEMDHAIRVQLLSKVKGIQQALDYFQTIPERYQTGMAYGILLTAYVQRNMERQALQLVQKMEKLGFSNQTYMYNQLLCLYKKNGSMKGVTDVLQKMDEKAVEPDAYTYNIILDIRKRKCDADGLATVYNQMQESKVEPDAGTYMILARGYLSVGLREKALEAAKKIETMPSRRKRVVRCTAVRIFGDIGEEREVRRLCNVIRGEHQKLQMGEYTSMIEATGKFAKSVGKAEKIFEEMEEKYGMKHVHQYNALLSVYANWGMVQKGEKILKKIQASYYPNPSTYHFLVQMYLNAANEDKAVEMLEVAQRTGKTSVRDRPKYITYQILLEFLAEKGDVTRAEKVMKCLKDVGYTRTYTSYCTLLKAYAKANKSPYGFLDRLSCDNLVPNQHIRTELKKLEGT